MVRGEVTRSWGGEQGLGGQDMGKSIPQGRDCPAPACIYLHTRLLATSILPISLQEVLCSEPPVLPFPHSEHPHHPRDPHKEPTAQANPTRTPHLGPGPLQGPLQFAKEQHSAGSAWGALADWACWENQGR